MSAEGKNGLTKKTSVFENGLIWFGAGVSIAEILTGTYLASLGMAKGVAAIFLGHLIGCCMMFAAGLIGARTGKSAMETVKMSFGKKGGLLFSFLNVLQLVGWTGIMIYDGALAANGTVNTGAWVWCLVIGALIVLWIAIGVTNLGKLNTVAMAALFLLTIVLCVVIFGNGMGQTAAGEAMTFGAAVELSVAMPLSWLPVISDYTREAQKPVKATAASVIVYGLVSCWMYIRFRENGADHSDPADAAARKLQHILLRNAADGDRRNGNRSADPAKRFVINLPRIRLGSGGEHSSHAEIIHSVLPGLYRLLRRSGGNADDLSRPKPSSGLFCLHILLAHMHAVRIEPKRQLHIIVDDERHMIAPADRKNLLRLPVKGLSCQLLFPKLNAGRAALQGILHPHGKRPVPLRAGICYGIQQQSFSFQVSCPFSFHAFFTSLPKPLLPGFSLTEPETALSAPALPRSSGIRRR